MASNEDIYLITGYNLRFDLPCEIYFSFGKMRSEASQGNHLTEHCSSLQNSSNTNIFKLITETLILVLPRTIADGLVAYQIS